MKPILVNIYLILLLLSCTNENERYSLVFEDNNIQNIKILDSSFFQLSFTENILTIKNNKLILMTDSLDPALDFFEDIQEDINNDNVPDVRVILLDADAAIEEWYVYDKILNKLNKVKGIKWIVNPKVLMAKSKFFYTNDPQGCDGNIWISHLLKVEKDSIMILARVIFNNCIDLNDEESTISFYKYQNDEYIIYQENESTIFSVKSYYGQSNEGLSIGQYWKLNIESYK